MDDAEEGFVAWEETGSAGESVALEKALTGMFGKDLDDTAAAGVGKFIPLEVASSMPEDGIEFIADEFIRGEDPDRMRILQEGLVQ